MKSPALLLATALFFYAPGLAFPQACPDVPIVQGTWRGTPLHEAILANDVAAAHRLMNAWTINEKDSLGNTPLLTALTPTQALEPAGIVDPQRNWALIRAENEARQAIAAALLSSGAAVNERGALGVTPLMKLAGSDYQADVDRALAERILAMGADVNARDAFGSTALITAARRQKLELATLLVSKGADPALTNCRGESAHPLLAPSR